MSKSKNYEWFKNNTLKIRLFIILFLATGVALILANKRRPDKNRDNEIAVFEVMQGPLTINVTESGTIKARELIIIKSELEGKTSILTLIPEGTRVKKGDLLIEMDSSNLLDDKIEQEIKVQNGEADFISARENLEVVKNQAQSDKEVAQLTLDFARQDLKKYMEGEYPNELKEAEGSITLAQEERTRAKDKYEWSKRLFDEKYISASELKADELVVMKKRLDLELAENNRNLLKNFTYKRKLAELESDVRQANMALERVSRKARADVIQAEAKLKAEESEFNRQKDKLKKIKDQISKTRIYAPADGLVIYATSAKASWRGNTEPLDEGQEVRERQELIYLPTAASFNAEIDIHESSLKKVKLGLPAKVSVDALPNRTFFGTVQRIAPLPDAQSMWMNPDLKVYNSDIFLDTDDPLLRTGMSCRAEIVVEHYENAIYIPVQAVLRIKNEATVFVVKGSKIEPRQVGIGLDNNRMVNILHGLAPGEQVLLAPPLKSGMVQSDSTELPPGDPIHSDGIDAVDKKINQSLEKIHGSEKNGQISPASVNREPSRRPGRGTPYSGSNQNAKTGERQRNRGQNISPEDREKMRKRFQNMSPEDREKYRQRRRNQ